MNEAVKFEIQDNVAIITINRPDKRNAINNAVVEGLTKAAELVDRSDEVRLAILTGAGEKAFCAGADIKEISDEDGLQRREKIEASHIIYGIRKPVIAMIRGFAVGGGFELALACDLRIAGESAKFGAPEITLGWIPGGGATQLLPRIIGQGKAMEMILTGEFVGAQKALEMGLVNRVFADEELLAGTLEFAKKLGEHSLTALKLGKEAVRMGSQLDIQSGFAYEKQLLGLCFYTKDKAEGVNKFLNR